MGQGRYKIVQAEESWEELLETLKSKPFRKCRSTEEELDKEIL